eukprot:Sdes_comp16219_c0_seq1m5498
MSTGKGSPTQSISSAKQSQPMIATSEVDKELVSIQFKDLVAKLERYQKKCDELRTTNSVLTERIEKETVDHKDIVTYLHAQLDRKEREIQDIQMKMIDTQGKFESSKDEYELQISTLTDSSRDKIEGLQDENRKITKKLEALEMFEKKKEKTEQQIIELESIVEKQKKENLQTIRDMEKKAVQDRDRLKKEMLQKVNEVVSNFRKISDKQMAETTKRTIRENISINNQLTKMSQKTTELISENDRLCGELKNARQKIEIFQLCEKDFVKKKKASEKITTMLVEKAKSQENNFTDLKEKIQHLEFQHEENCASIKREMDLKNSQLEVELKSLAEKYEFACQEKEEIEAQHKKIVQLLSETTAFVMNSLQEAKKKVYQEKKFPQGGKNQRGKDFEDDAAISLQNDFNSEEKEKILEFMMKKLQLFEISRGSLEKNPANSADFSPPQQFHFSAFSKNQLA